MNAERLLAHYERIADAPDAVSRLRQFVLDLAVRGKLVPQDPNDEPASELLKRLSRSISAAQTRTRRSVRMESAEPEYSLPSSWAWVRIGDHVELLNGMAFKPSDWQPSGLKIVRIQNLNRPSAPFNYCNPEKVRERFLIDDGDFLISWSGTPGTSFGAFIWDRGPAALNQHIFRCDFRMRAFEATYLRLAINGRLDEMIAKAHGGVGLQHITKGKLEALMIALPPLAEQHRIVAKVDELMALCDRLEAARAERESTRDRLTAASLARLNEPEPGPAFAQHARFALDHLDALTARPDQIQQLRQTILNLAVRGKLVPQDPADAPVEDMLKAIEREQREAIRAGQLKARVLGDEVAKDPDRTPPRGWALAPLRRLIVFGPQNGVSPRQTEELQAPKSLTLTATTSGTFDPQHYKHVDISAAACENYWLEPDDVLFQRGNTREFVGIAAIYTGPQRQFVFPDLMIRVRFSGSVDLRFIHQALVAGPLRAYFSLRATGTSKTMPKINQDVLLQAPVPVPPLAEQHRIVAKVDELMALCDRLEASLTSSSDTRRRLLDALLAEALVEPDSVEPHKT